MKHENLETRASAFLAKRQKRNRWIALVTVMCLVVVGLTIDITHREAVTMERIPSCGIEEHVHSEACYTRQYDHEAYDPIYGTVPVYVGNFSVHQHTEECYDWEGNLNCGYRENAYFHTHSQYCYDENGNLVCGLEEIPVHEHTEECFVSYPVLCCGLNDGDGAHVHTEACYSELRSTIPNCGLEESAGHVHSADCYARILSCGQIEGQGHVHTDACYTPNLTCELAENPGHVHTEVCYAYEPVCGMEENAGHVHSVDCYTRMMTCGLEIGDGAHAHTESCYEDVVELICGQEEGDSHTHTADCYAVVHKLTCGQEENAGHVHTDACFEDVLTCGLEEGAGAHIHDESCFGFVLVCGMQEGEGAHIHDANCYTYILSCGQEEGEGVHVHTDACYSDTLICEIPEGTGAHMHTEECYPLIWQVTCGQEENSGHVHTDACYTWKTDTVCEYANVHVHTEECWSYDMLGRKICICGMEEIPVFETTPLDWRYDEILLDPGHVHDESCSYIDVLTCDKAEHIHTDSCYQVVMTATPTGEKTPENTDNVNAAVENTDAVSESVPETLEEGSDGLNEYSAENGAENTGDASAAAVEEGEGVSSTQEGTTVSSDEVQVPSVDNDPFGGLSEESIRALGIGQESVKTNTDVAVDTSSHEETGVPSEDEKELNSAENAATVSESTDENEDTETVVPEENETENTSVQTADDTTIEVPEEIIQDDASVSEDASTQAEENPVTMVTKDAAQSEGSDSANTPAQDLNDVTDEKTENNGTEEDLHDAQNAEADAETTEASVTKSDDEEATEEASSVGNGDESNETIGAAEDADSVTADAGESENDVEDIDTSEKTGDVADEESLSEENLSDNAEAENVEGETTDSENSEEENTEEGDSSALTDEDTEESGDITAETEADKEDVSNENAEAQIANEDHSDDAQDEETSVDEGNVLVLNAEDLIVTALDVEAAEAAVASLQLEGAESSHFMAWDLALVDEELQASQYEVQLTLPVVISVADDEKLEAVVYHLHNDVDEAGNEFTTMTEIIPEISYDEEGNAIGLTLITDGFSTFVLKYAVVHVPQAFEAEISIPETGDVDLTVCDTIVNESAKTVAEIWNAYTWTLKEATEGITADEENPAVFHVEEKGSVSYSTEDGDTLTISAEIKAETETDENSRAEDEEYVPVSLSAEITVIAGETVDLSQDETVVGDEQTLASIWNTYNWQLKEATEGINVDESVMSAEQNGTLSFTTDYNDVLSVNVHVRQTVITGDGIVVEALDGTTLPSDAEATQTLEEDAVFEVPVLPGVKTGVSDNADINEESVQIELPKTLKKAQKKTLRTASMDTADITLTNDVMDSGSKLEAGQYEDHTVFEISLNSAEELTGKVRVTVTPNETIDVLKNLPAGAQVKQVNYVLYHEHEGIVETLSVNVDEENGIVNAFTFETDSFSTFVLSYTVDFEYSVNGKMYQFSLPGGGYMTLHQLVEVLGIIGDTNFESADEFIRYIDNVEFSDPELVQVTKINEDTVIEFSDATGDGEDELWAVKDPVRGNLTSAFDVNPITGSLEVSAGDWLLESLAPFTSEETLTITMKKGDVVMVKVTDAQYGSGNIEIPASGVVSLLDVANIAVSCQSNTTDVEWDAAIDFLLRYVFTEEGVSAVTSYARQNHTSPIIEYDFSQIFDETALNSAVETSFYLSTGSKTVGRLTVTADGKVQMVFTDLDWLVDRNSIRGTFNLDLLVDEDEAKENGSDTVTFPGTTNGTDITYKTTVSNASKSLGWPNSVENDDGSITIFYNATIDANTALSNLVFTDTITDGSAIIDASSVKVNGNSVSGLSNGQNMSFDLANVSGLEKTDGGKLKAGRYTVSYTATIPASEVASMAQGEKETIVNTSKWKADGKDEIEVPPVTYEWTKPVTPIPVTKSADKTSVNMTSGTSQTVNYTLTFGDENTPLADFRIADYITDVFTDYSAINVSWNGGSTTLTAGGQATDNTYSAGSVTLFDYTFPSDNTAHGPVTVTYSAKTIDATTAKKNNIFDTVNATNTAQELRTNNSQTSTTVITYPERPDISVSKTASIPDEYKNPDGTLKDGATITYTITIGDANTDISNLNITDSMSHLQSVDLSTATIKIGTGSSQSLTDYITSVNGSYDQNWYVGGGNSNLFNFTVPAGENDSEVMGPIVITYTTTVMSTEDANAANIWGSQNVNNTVSAGGKSSTDGGTKDYGEQPRFPVDKTAKDSDDQEITSALQPGDTINYTVTYGGEGWTLDGTTLLDQMSDIQKLASGVTVTLDKALMRTITWPDGTVWEAGQTSFTMPIGSSQWAEDGVVWTDFFDDGKYSLSNDWPRVYCLKLPDGRSEENPYFAEGTQMTVTYSTTVITEAEALESSITGLQNAYNKTTANNQSSQTQVPVQFPNEVTHVPAIQKEFSRWDFENRMVYWTIIVKAGEGSTYPLDNVYVRENVVWNGVSIKNSNQGIDYTVISADAFDMINAKIVTDSGAVLQPGEDYTVHKGSGLTDDPYFYFETLEESVTITVGYSIGANDIVDGFHAENTARVDGGNTSKATQDYNTPKIDMTKNGDAYDPAKRVIKWIVRVNPAKKTLDPDLTQVLFDDAIPNGLQLINYSDFLAGNVNTNAPSIYVAYSGKVSGAGREYGVSSYSPGRWSNGVQSGEYDRVVFATITNTSIHANIAAVGVYNDENSNAYLSEESYTVTYYTWVTDEAWDEITSSLTGSETFTNTATVDMGDRDDLTGTGSRTVTSDSFIWKEDTTQENNDGIVIDSNGQTTNTLSYQIDVNPYGMQLVSEENAKLTLTDRISTNMDLDTSGDGITIEYETANGSFVNIRSVGSDNEYYDAFQEMKVSYNDDTRYVTITNIPDKVHFRITYDTVVRAQGTDTFENTAVLTGGGSHSASTNETHTIQKGGGNIAGNTANITLRKIDENDISVKVEGATFEVYKCTLSNPNAWKHTVRVPIINDLTGEVDHWIEEQHFDFNRIEAATPNTWTGYAGNGETAQLKADFTITDETLLGEVHSEENGVVHMPDILNEETLYYWVETAAADGYTAELNVKHYFIVYQVYDDNGNLMDTVTQEVDSAGNALEEWEAKQWRGWALDDAAQYANSVTVASLAAENTWTVNNQKGEYTSISATKEWQGDYDNFYESRPEEGIQLKLIQVSSDGTEKQYGPIIPINVDDNGNWPTYVWQQLPKNGTNDNEETVTYTYRVEEIPVAGYTTTYSNAGAIESGEITVTNTLIPTKTNVSVKKVFEQDGTTYPDQILVYLYEITTNKETGAQTRAQRSSYALTAAGGWAYTWKNLPTKDDDGNTLTYTVVEGPVGDGFSYTVSYSDNGEGITGNTVDDPLVITNTENGLEITKTFGGDAARLMEDTETAAAMRALISFTVTDGTNQVSFTVADMTANSDGSYSFKLTSTTYPWLTPGKTVYVQETNEAFTNTDLVSVSYAINGGDAVTVTENMETVTVSGYTVSGGLDTIDFTNEYHEDTVSLSVDKTWLNVDGQEEDAGYWPEGMTVTFNLTADEGNGAIATGDTGVMTGAGQTVTFTDLPKYVLNTNTEIVYSVTETVDGYESSISNRTVNAEGNVSITVTNKKASPRLYVQKVWNGSSDFIPSNLTIDLYESETAGATTGGGLINTITLTADDEWKGYFETDSDGNKLVEGHYYYIVERGVGGWTLSGYSEENGQAFVDMETITVTNTRNTTPPPPGKTSVSVQKKWTVNGEEADAEDWDAVHVQLMRYKAEKPKTGVNVYVVYQNGGTVTSYGKDGEFGGYVDIPYTYNGTGNPGIDQFPVYAFTKEQTNSQATSSKSYALSASGGTLHVDLTDAYYEGAENVYLLVRHMWYGNAGDFISIGDLTGGSASTDDLTWAGPEVVTYQGNTSFTLDASNSWQYEFTDLDTEGTEGTTKYLYKYTLVETPTSQALADSTVSTTTGGEKITVTDGSQVDVGGNVVITNNKDYGSITVKKSVLKNNAPDADAVGQTITVGLFTAAQENGSQTTPAKTAEITIGSGSTGAVSFDKLALDQTYYIYEIIDGKVVTDGNTATINGVEYTAGQETASAALSAEIKTATIDITNSRTEDDVDIEATKQWLNADGTDMASNPTDMRVTFDLYADDVKVEGKSIVLDGTVDALGESEAWKALWTGLDKKNASDQEITYTVKESKVEKTSDGGTTWTDVTNQYVAGTWDATNKTITNKPVDFEFSKVWKFNGTDLAWQQPITVTLNAYTTDQNTPALSETQYTLSPDSHEGWAYTAPEEGSYVYTFSITGLQAVDENGNELHYYVQESDPSGFTKGYATKEGQSIINGNKATNGQRIVNTQEGGYVLPSTGGPGTRLFTVLGSILILFAGAGFILLQRKKRVG
ncbi:MAG: Cna B-type domain-containing protein [Clostridia bacterium]|nr:Cna B-type domain-containing protein [Clostridia bacterium]